MINHYHQYELFTSEHRNNWFYKQIKQICPDKICMDIGVGSGILSLFAIHAGASHVYMIEHNPDCCNIIEKVFKSANIPSTKYTLIREEFNSNFEPIDKIDVIISETITSNFFRDGYQDICKAIQDNEALKDAIMIPDKIYGSFVFFDDVSVFDKLKSESHVITTGVDEVDKDYTFSSNLLKPYQFYNARLWRPETNPLYHELRNNAKETTSHTMTDAIIFDAYNPNSKLEWRRLCMIPNKTYGIMLIGRIACEKIGYSKAHTMNLDVWATCFYKFKKMSDILNITFNDKEKNFVFNSI